MAFAYRYVMAILISVGLAIIYGLKVNLSVAIVSMVNHTQLHKHKTNVTTNQDEPCATTDNKTGIQHEDGPFVWSPSMQGSLLGSYFGGYLISMFPGSQVAEKVSAKWVYFSAVTVNIICTLVLPLSCNIHYGLAFCVRVIQGLGGGVSFPTTHVLLAHWAPPNERSLMASLAFSGSTLGTVLSNYFSGFIAVNWSWEWVFYSQGSLSIIWLIMWWIFAADKPRKLRFVSKKEKDYIESALGEPEDSMEKHKVPWLSICKSVPFWAILTAHTCSNWAFYMLLTNMPLYYKSVLKFSIEQTSMYAAIPYFIMWIFCMVLGQTLDTLRKRQKITTTFARKFATGVASAPVMICLFVLTFFACNKIISVILFTISLTAMGAMFCGFMANHIDIANNYAGTLMGLTNTIATIPGIVGPIFVGFMIDNDPTIRAWKIVFYVTCSFLLVELLVYSIFGTGEEQPWNKPQTSSTE